MKDTINLTSGNHTFKQNKRIKYQKNRIAHWNQISSLKENEKRIASYYHELLQHYYRFLIPPNLRVLELGCGHGNLLAALQPAFGVGVDFSNAMLKFARQKHTQLLFIQADAHNLPIKEKFDVIILSDLLNDLWDVQDVLEKLLPLTHSGTRLVLNTYNNLWRVPLAIIRRLGLGANLLEQNWLTPHDVYNLLELAGFEIICHRPFILLPLNVPVVSKLFNRYLTNLLPFSWLVLSNFITARPKPSHDRKHSDKGISVSVIIPARNESGNIESILKRVPNLGIKTELIFVEGHSKDNTYETILNMIQHNPDRKCKVFRQQGNGKGDAVRLGFEKADGEILVILDADLSVPPEDLKRFVAALISGKGEFINGVRLVYPLEDQSMRFFNMVGNKFFSLAFSWLLGQPIKDTLCGTKVLWKKDYIKISRNRDYFGNFDPFGDFDLLFGAAKLNLKIIEIPVRYRSRTYGTTNIDRWQHGWLLLKMVFFAAKRIKCI